MSTPIISPWIFYLIYILSGLKSVSFIIFIISSILTLFFFGETIFYREEIEYWKNNKEKIEKCKAKIKMYESIVKKLLIGVIFCLFLWIVIPSKNIMYKMVIAKYITYENLSKIHNLTKNDIKEILKIMIDKNKNNARKQK